MAKASLKTVSKLMKGLDLCMLTTTDGRGVSSSRPMSNNGDVEFDGTSYFFSYDDTRAIHAIKKNPEVSLQFSKTGAFRKPVFVSVSGHANLIKDRAEMEDHWNKDLEIWFEDGLDTEGIVMIEVEAQHIKYWSGNEEGEYTASSGKKSAKKTSSKASKKSAKKTSKKTSKKR